MLCVAERATQAQGRTVAREGGCEPSGMLTGACACVRVCPLRLLKPQEDEVAQHYAVKTIENICSQVRALLLHTAGLRSTATGG